MTDCRLASQWRASFLLSCAGGIGGEMVGFSSTLFGDTSESVLSQILSEYENEAIRSFYFGTNPFPRRVIQADHHIIDIYSKLMANWVNDGFDTWIDEAIRKREDLIKSDLTDDERKEVIEDVFASYVIDAGYLRQWVNWDFSNSPYDVIPLPTPPIDDETILAIYLYGLIHGMYKKNPFVLSETIWTYKQLILSIATEKKRLEQKRTLSRNAKKNMNIFNYEKMLQVFNAVSSKKARNKTELYLNIAGELGTEISSMEQKGYRYYTDFKCWFQLIKLRADDNFTSDSLKTSREIVVKLGDDIEKRFEEIREIIQKHIKRLNDDGIYKEIISYHLPAFDR